MKCCLGVNLCLHVDMFAPQMLCINISLRCCLSSSSSLEEKLTRCAATWRPPPKGASWKSCMWQEVKSQTDSQQMASPLCKKLNFGLRTVLLSPTNQVPQIPVGFLGPPPAPASGPESDIMKAIIMSSNLLPSRGRGQTTYREFTPTAFQEQLEDLSSSASSAHGGPGSVAAQRHTTENHFLLFSCPCPSLSKYVQLEVDRFYDVCDKLASNQILLIWSK